MFLSDWLLHTPMKEMVQGFYNKRVLFYQQNTNECRFLIGEMRIINIHEHEKHYKSLHTDSTHMRDWPPVSYDNIVVIAMFPIESTHNKIALSLLTFKPKYCCSAFSEQENILVVSLRVRLIWDQAPIITVNI